MRTINRTLLLAITLTASWTAFGAGGGPSSTPSSGAPARTLSPEEMARSAYDAGVRGVQKAEELLADAARQVDAGRQQKLRDKAGKSFAGAARKFDRATDLDPRMHEAWNYLGYCHRKQGRLDEALAAYDRALALKPGYAEAIEYRGHAYLGLNRLAEAKTAYLALYGSNRQLAASLLAAMQQWAGQHADADFAAWVSERSSIAAQTAALTRDGAAAAWK